jgi:hypothetical protein
LMFAWAIFTIAGSAFSMYVVWDIVDRVEIRCNSGSLS